MEFDIDTAFAELGLTPEATDLEVKAAWRRLISQWHPDRNDSTVAVAKMQRINRAVEAIRRAGGSRPAAAEAPPPPEPGPPLRTINRKVKLTLREAAFGCTKVLRGKLTHACQGCEGVGYRSLGGHCQACQGSGAVRERTWFGWSSTPVECAACHGGGIARQVCGGCEGSGKAAPVPYKVSVRFPQGVRHGDVLTVDGRRKPGSPGDLSIRVEVEASALLALDEDGTLRCEVPVNGFAWVAGRSVQVPTLDGLYTLALQRDQVSYRLPGMGFPVQRGGSRGDQVVTVTPVFPRRMNNDQQILLDQLVASTRESDERLSAWNQALRAWQPGQGESS